MRGELITREVPFYNNLTTFSIQIDQTVSVTEYYYPDFSIVDFLANLGGSLGLWLGLGVLQMGEMGTNFFARKDNKEKGEPAESKVKRRRRKTKLEVEDIEINKQEEKIMAWAKADGNLSL